MIPYLLYTTVCMGLVLLFYHLVLVREKMYQINRWYLLIGLSFSLVVPFLPVGVVNNSLSLVTFSEPSILKNGLGFMTNGSAIHESVGVGEGASNELLNRGLPVLLFVYSFVVLCLLMRIGWQFLHMRTRAMKNPVSFFKGHRVVLLDEEVVPHTFMKTIHVSREQFERGRITNEILLHELTHAKENHTLDILYIELLKAIYWFNPLLYYYKRAIQMNHEFIADHNVLSGEGDITSYQQALLSLSKRKPAGTLSSSLNFNTTKKRFQMMASSTSTYRYILKSVIIVPFFAILGLTFGCEPAGMEKDTQAEKVYIEILGNKMVKLDGRTIPVSNFAHALSNLLIDPDKVIVYMNINDSATMGTVTDVQTVLREQGTFKINYSTISPGTADPKTN